MLPCILMPLFLMCEPSLCMVVCSGCGWTWWSSRSFRTWAILWFYDQSLNSIFVSNSLIVWYFARYRYVFFFPRIPTVRDFEVSSNSVLVILCFLFIPSHWKFEFSTNDVEQALVFFISCSCAERHLESYWHYG